MFDDECGDAHLIAFYETNGKSSAYHQTVVNPTVCNVEQTNYGEVCELRRSWDVHASINSYKISAEGSAEQPEVTLFTEYPERQWKWMEINAYGLLTKCECTIRERHS